MIDSTQSLKDFKKANNVIVRDEFYEFDTEDYEKNVLSKRPWRKE